MIKKQLIHSHQGEWSEKKEAEEAEQNEKEGENVQLWFQELYIFAPLTQVQEEAP